MTPVPGCDRRDDLLGAGHLRHARRIDEADRLDPRQARGREAVDELGAHDRLERDRVVLEPVARPDVADRHRGAQITPSSRRDASSSAPRPSSPP